MDRVILWGLLCGVALLLFRKPIIEQVTLAKTDFKSWFKRFWKEWGEPFVVAAVIALVIRTFALGPYKIPTGSMIPTLMVGDRIFVDKITYRFRDPERGEIIVFKYPEDEKKDFVKRLVAIGGDEVIIRDGQLFVNGKELNEISDVPSVYYYNRNDWEYGKVGQVIHVPDESYFVLGDNSAHSSDSRNWGFVKHDQVVGRAFVIWWPLNRIGFTD